jgi:hypothetical protein
MTAATSTERPTAEFPNAATKARKSRSKAVSVAARPNPVDPVLKVFHGLWFSDTIGCPEDLRARVQVHAASLEGTNRGEALSERRGWMVADWLVRSLVPDLLDNMAVPLDGQAAALRALAPITSEAHLQDAEPLLECTKTLAEYTCEGNPASVSSALADDEQKALEEGLQEATVRVRGSFGLYAAVHTARRLMIGTPETEPDEVDMFAEPFPQAIELIMSIVDLVLDAEAVVMAGGAAQGIRVERNKGEVAEFAAQRAAHDAALLALSEIQRVVLNSTHRLFETMVRADTLAPAVAEIPPNVDFLDLLGETHSHSVRERREWIALDWLVREYAADTLDIRPELGCHANGLKILAEITDLETLQAAGGALRRARRDAVLVANRVLRPFIAADEDYLELDESSAVPPGFPGSVYRLLRELNDNNGSSSIVDHFHDRAAKLMGGYIAWDTGVAILRADVAQLVASAVDAANMAEVFSVLVDDNGKLPAACDRFGPAAERLTEHEAERGISRIHAQRRMRAVTSGNTGERSE